MEHNKELNDRGFAQTLLDNSYGTSFLFIDDEGNEYTFDEFGECMFGSLHNIIRIKKTTNEREKWFPNLETQIEMLKEEINEIEKLTEEYPIKHPEKYAESPTLYSDYLASKKYVLETYIKEFNYKNNGVPKN